MVAVASVIVVVILSIIVARVATVALTVTGLSREAARFQARSALTGAGFTTSESEGVVDHPVRRRIISTLMLIGSAGIVTIIATLMLSFVGAQGRRDATIRLLVLIAALLAILWAARSDRVDRWLTQVIARLLRRYTDLDTRDYARLLKLSGDYAITEFTVREGDWVADRALQDLELTEEGIIVLGIQRADGSYVGAPRGSSPVCAGDTLIVYGRGRRLSELDARPVGRDGDEAHARAAQEQRLVETVEHATDLAQMDEEAGTSP